MLQLARSGNSGHGSNIIRESFDRNDSEDGLKQYARKTLGATQYLCLKQTTSAAELEGLWNSDKLGHDSSNKMNSQYWDSIWVHEWHCSMQCQGLKNASLASPSKMLEKRKQVKRWNCTVCGLQVSLNSMDCWKVGAKRKETCPLEQGGEGNEENVTWSLWNLSQWHQELVPMRGAWKWVKTTTSEPSN